MAEEEGSPCVHPDSTEELAREINRGGKNPVRNIEGVEELFCYAAVEEES
jgi:hypothetical protein